MSKQLFEFVKVAAGEPFPFPTAHYYWAYQPELYHLTGANILANDIAERDYYILRPVLQPDAIPPEGWEEKMNDDTDLYLAGFNHGKEQVISDPAAFGIRPAESPDAGREGFIQDASYYADKESTSREMLVDFMRSHWPAPADPGSQVEARKFLGYLREHAVERTTGSWAPKHDWDGENKPIEDMLLIYQQSLNEEQLSKHTPGPWHVGLKSKDNATLTVYATNEDLEYIAKVPNDPLLLRGKIQDHTANARLIAEAPEMYSALSVINELDLLKQHYPGLHEMIQSLLNRINP